MIETQALRLSVTLPHPLGINVTSRAGHRTPKAVQRWQDDAAILLHLAGFRSQPPGVYWAEMTQVLWTQRHDLDAVEKLVTDAVFRSLGIGDHLLAELLLRKAWAPTPANQRVEVWVKLEPVRDRDAWRLRAATNAVWTPAEEVTR